MRLQEVLEMRKGRIDSLTTVIICSIALWIILAIASLVGLWNAVEGLAESVQTTQELTMQNRELINHLSDLNRAQNDIIIGGRK